jgi:hypothetical protein
MGLVEGFAEFALENENHPGDEGGSTMSFQMKLFLLIVVIKVLMVYLVSQFIWPRFIPKIFTNVKANPGFGNLLGLVVIYYLLF